MTISRVAALEAVLAAIWQVAETEQQDDGMLQQMEQVLSKALHGIAAACQQLGPVLQRQEGTSSSTIDWRPHDWARLQQGLREAAVSGLGQYWSKLKAAPKGSHVVALHKVRRVQQCCSRSTWPP
jgi:hypothetical protein